MRIALNHHQFPDKGRIRITLIFLFLACIAFFSTNTLAAEWNIITHNDMDSNTVTSVAIIKNDSGHTLEIYRDSVNAVRARFTLNQGLIQFPDNFCPTFQIDSGPPSNRSLNDALCLSGATSTEFILGYVADDQINSSVVADLMNGVVLNFRFLLENGDYRQTLFSLSGSKRTMSAAFGDGVRISSVNSF
jgi:hypothetical protein